VTIVDKIDLLNGKKAQMELGGGADRIERQHASGKLTARERLLKLFDSNTFVELDSFVETASIDFGMQEKKVPGDGVIIGYGTVNERLVYAFAQDFTVLGGALGAAYAKKICKIMDMAAKMGAPLVGLYDTSGARIEEGVDALAGYGDIVLKSTLLSGLIPQISVILGPCAGSAVFSPAISDFIFLVENTGSMFLSGPQLVKSATGKEITLEELGGARVHTASSGVAHFKCAGEEECLLELKRLLGFLPDNNLSDTPAYACTDDVNRMTDALCHLIPDQLDTPYDMAELIRTFVDNGEFFEVQSQFAQNLLAGFGRLNGRTVGFVANQPLVMNGALDLHAADKGARFVRFCDAFNIPLVSLTDTAGYYPDAAQEHGGIIRHGAKLLYAFAEATVPKVGLILRKAYGGAYVAMNSKHLGADLVYAWPSAEISVMSAEGAANVLFRDEIAASDDPVSTRSRKIEEYRQKVANPYTAASKGYVDDVIDPAETRIRLINALDMLASKRENRPSKKHGNIPL